MKPFATRYAASLWMIAALLIMGAQARAQGSGDFARCSTIDDAAQRLACYDAASGRDERPPESAAPEVEEAVEALTDDIGEEQLHDKERPSKKAAIVRGTITSCRKDASGRHYFYFDNGQVWKQKDSDKLPFRSCNFDVVIQRDFFGYKMRIEGQSADIRISRIK